MSDTCQITKIGILINLNNCNCQNTYVSDTTVHILIFFNNYCWQNASPPVTPVKIEKHKILPVLAIIAVDINL